jgi:Transposase DDE domain
MIRQDSLLVTLVRLVDRIPTPCQAKKRGRGRPTVYSDRLFLKALVIMIVRHLRTVHELLAVLEQPTTEMETLHSLLWEDARFPSRRTWERRLTHLPASLPAQIGCLGRSLVELIDPWQTDGRAVAIDSTILRARGGQWHQKHREQGVIPHTSIDTEAHWTKSGWHGWIYGWKLHLIWAVAAVWIALAAELTAANVADSEQAPMLLRELPAEVRFVLGDRHYNREELHALCWQDGRFLVTTTYGRYPHTDAGVEVRRTFHKLRSVAIENFNEHFKGIFDGHGQVPTKGLLATQRFALGAVFVYQLALWYRFEHGLDLCLGLKAFLKSA